VSSKATGSARLADLLVATKDGDWGGSTPRDGYVPYRVIRGADFPNVRIGQTSGIPICYLDASTVHRRTLQPDDIIIETAGGNRDRPTGRTVLITERLLNQLDLPATCASFCRFLRVDSVKAEPRYLFWYLQYLYSRGDMWEHQVQHTGVARFQYTKFAETIIVPLPPPSEQRAIAGVLGALDEKIELNWRMSETLEATARAIFKSWFVELDVRQGSRSSPPGGWASGRFADVAVIEREAINPADFPEETFDHYSIPAFDERQLPLAETGKAIKSNKFIVATDAVLLSKLNPRIPRVWMPDVQQGRRSICSTEFLVLRPSRVSREYLYGLCTSAGLLQEFATMVTGTSGSHQRVKPEFLDSMGVVIPNASAVQQFTGLTAPIYQRVALNRRESETLAEVRDTLLPKLISGEIRLRDAEKNVGAAI
jgi:type I restriction enzyme S subunit